MEFPFDPEKFAGMLSNKKEDLNADKEECKAACKRFFKAIEDATEEDEFFKAVMRLWMDGFECGAQRMIKTTNYIFKAMENMKHIADQEETFEGN